MSLSAYQKSSWNLLLPVFLIYVVGLLMIFDASSGEIVDLASSRSPFAGFLKQLVYGLLATIVFLMVLAITWRPIFAKIEAIYWFFVILLILVFVPGIGVCANGARRWIGFASIHIQPSEFIKIFLPAYFIHQCNKQKQIYERFSAFALLLGKVFIPVFLIALEPNNGTAGVIALMIGVLTLIMGLPWRFWLIPLLVLAGGLVIFASTNNHVQHRIMTYLHPELDLKGKGHQPYQAKIAAGSGGLFGKGPAKSMQKLSYLPEAQNDYIVAIYAEEFGFCGIMLLLFVYGWLIYEVARIVSQTECKESFCYSMSLLYLLSFQTFMNFGVVSGLLPSTGLNLPFFSQGGSSLVANLLGIALLKTMEAAPKVRSLV
jgi:cell division protein FtsW